MNDDVVEKGRRTMPTSVATEETILVTGGSGLAGSAVIREFARNRHPVRALVRSRAKARAFEAFPTVELMEGDMTRPETLEAALSGRARAWRMMATRGAARRRRRWSAACPHP